MNSREKLIRDCWERNKRFWPEGCLIFNVEVNFPFDPGPSPVTDILCQDIVHNREVLKFEVKRMMSGTGPYRQEYGLVVCEGIALDFVEIDP